MSHIGAPRGLMGANTPNRMENHCKQSNKKISILKSSAKASEKPLWSLENQGFTNSSQKKLALTS